MLASGVAAETPPAPEDPLIGKKVELRGVEQGIENISEEKRKIDQGLLRIEAERARLAQVLIDAAARLRETEKQTAEVEAEVQKIDSRQEALRASLHERRAIIGEVLLVLQRMNRRPPPALLAEPEDILKALRAAMAMGAVLPQMRAETTRLQNDLAELVRLRDAAQNERANLTRRRDELTLQRANVEQMIEERRAASQQMTSERAAQEERARKLAEQATSVKDLIARMEKESQAARLAAQAARDAEARREAADAQASREQRAKALAQPFRDPARLAPAVGFADLKGKLQLPAVGAFLRRFGESDGYGGAERGEFARSAGKRPRFSSLRRVGGLCRPLSQLRRTLDHQCGRWLLCRLGRGGQDQCGRRTVRSRRRTRSAHGRWSGEDGRGSRDWRKTAHFICRDPQGRKLDRPEPMVGPV